MDMGVQATHISNQSLIFALRPEARNRINTIYMVTYFIGGGFGTYLAAQAWAHYKWTGVCILGIAVSAMAVAAHLLSHRIVQKIRRGV
jgi:predicted MFS family arabinose efflux permease